MKCTTCQTPMIKSQADVDYTRLASLRGKAVTLIDVTTYQCERCGPTSRFVELPRWGSLVRELEACHGLRVKHLWCRFESGEWTFSFATATDG